MTLTLYLNIDFTFDLWFQLPIFLEKKIEYSKQKYTLNFYVYNFTFFVKFIL